jgi:uncharacterized protein
MGFEKFGVVSHMKESKAEDFVTYLEEGKIMATKCKSCNHIYFPPQVDCPHCLTNDMEWIEIKGSGKLVTYSTVNYGPQGFEDKAPYTIALAKFPEGINIFAAFNRDIKESDIKIGMAVRAIPVKLAEGKISFEFQVP